MFPFTLPLNLLRILGIPEKSSTMYSGIETLKVDFLVSSISVVRVIITADTKVSKREASLQDLHFAFYIIRGQVLANLELRLSSVGISVPQLCQIIIHGYS